MKTLDEIIKRNDYVRVTAQLRNRAHELAEIVREKMESIELEGVRITHKDDTSSCYVVIGLSYDGFKESTLTYHEHGFGTEYYDLEGWKTNTISFRYGYILREQTHYLRTFLNDCRAILNEIDRIESERVSECEQSLKNAEGLK